MTDGYVGNDMEIISEVQKHPNARVFSFGIGGSVNRFLLDKMAEHGRGEVEYVALTDDGSAAARRFHERVRNPLLTDVSIDWSGLPVADVYPKRVSDLFSAKPVVISGRYSAGGKGVIKLKGKMSGRDFVREIPVELPDNEPRHDVLATLWARTRIDELMSQDYAGVQSGNLRDDVREAITQLGLGFRLMTQFTSFVAVEEMTITDGGEPRRIEVPVELPAGVQREGVVHRGNDMSLGVGGAFSVSTSAAEMVVVTSNESVIDREKSQISTTYTPRSSAWPSPPLPQPPPPPKTKASKSPGSGSVGGIGSGSGGGVGPGPGRGVSIDGVAGNYKPLSPEEQRRQELLSKLNPSIASVIDRLKNKNSKPGADEARFVRDGKAEIQVWLANKSPETLAQLKELGFEIVLDPKTAKMIIGRVSIEKLAALAELEAVRYIAPMTNK
jgi:hypothetical protein